VKKLAAAIFAVALAAAIFGCSPEATRTRGGGPGADVGNHSPNSPSPATPPSAPGG